VNNQTPIILAGDFNIKYDDQLMTKFTEIGLKHVYGSSSDMPFTRPATKGRIDHIMYINLINTNRQVLTEYD